MKPGVVLNADVSNQTIQRVKKPNQQTFGEIKMINWNKITQDESVIVGKIVKRAVKELGVKDILSAQMDISAAHIEMPIKLNELLKADKFNFGHDVAGIINNMNRATSKLDNCFVPRFAR